MHTLTKRARLTTICVTSTVTLGLVAACSGGGAETSGAGDSSLGPVVESTWGEAWTEAEKKYFADPFTKETGIKVVFKANGTSPSAPALLQAESGRMTFDIVDAPNALVLKDQGLVADFPSDVMSTIKRESRSGEYSPYELKIGRTTSLIACNADMVKRCPTNAEEFWDVKNFPGTRAIRNRPVYTMLFALRAEGVPKDSLYPIDINRAMKKVQDLKPDVKVFPSGTAQEYDVMVNKEAAINFTASGIAYRAQKELPNLKLFWDDGVISASDGYVVMKDAPHKEAAFKYIQWIASHPEAQAKWTEAVFYPAPAKDLGKYLDKKLLKALPIGHESEIITVDDEWEIKHGAAAQKAWQKTITQ